MNSYQKPVIIFLCAFLTSISFATTPTTNGNNITMVRASAETAGGKVSTNGNGLTFETSKTDQSSIGTVNGSNIVAYLGQLDIVIFVIPSDVTIADIREYLLGLKELNVQQLINADKNMDSTVDVSDIIFMTTP